MGVYLNLKLLLRAALLLTMITGIAGAAWAADPGIPIPPGSEINDLKPGSVLVYSYFTSSAAAPATQDTRICITNVNPTLPVTVHLFYVDGATCAVADRFVCLTQNQTDSVFASNQDPGVTGYLVASAVDSATGCPISFNFLTGDAAVKLASGHRAMYNAEAIAALYTGTLAGCDANSVTATLNFDGVSYNRLPRVLALDKIGSAVEGNSTLLVVNRIGGNLAVGAAPLGPVFGLLFNDDGEPHSFTFTAQSCQVAQIMSDAFPHTAPPFTTVIPAGRTGWLKLWADGDFGILGVAINFNPNTATNRSAFRGGDNLHKLSLAGPNSLIVPVIVPPC